MKAYLVLDEMPKCCGKCKLHFQHRNMLMELEDFCAGQEGQQINSEDCDKKRDKNCPLAYADEEREV